LLIIRDSLINEKYSVAEYFSPLLLVGGRLIRRRAHSDALHAANFAVHTGGKDLRCKLKKTQKVATASANMSAISGDLSPIDTGRNRKHIAQVLLVCAHQHTHVDVPDLQLPTAVSAR
jgi:hypothetical protein